MIIHIFRSPVLKGYVVANGEVVRDSDGLAVRREPVMSDEVWSAVQTALDAGSQDHSAKRSDATFLLHVAYCGECQAPLYLQAKKARGYGYYVCSGRAQGRCRARSMRDDVLEKLITETLLQMCGGAPMRSKVIHPAQSHAADLAAVDEAIANLQAQLVAGKISADLFGSTAQMLEARQASLRALPSTPESVEWIPTGQTFGEHWEALDEAGQRAFMIRAGITAHVSEDDGLPIKPRADQAFIRLAGGFKILINLGDLAKLSELASRAQ